MPAVQSDGRDNHLRERKTKRKQKVTQIAESGVKPKPKSRFSSLSRLVACATLALASLVFINYPKVIIQILEPWIDLTDTLPGTSSAEYVHLGADVVRRDAVVDAFKRAWAAYERDAFGADEYLPLSQAGSNLTEGVGCGYTIVDALDTMLIMGLQEEYSRARDWVEQSLNFEIDGIYSVFETTIRVLGGLLSAFYLTKDPLFKTKAIDLADRLMVAFASPSGLPTTMVNLKERIPILDATNGGLVSTAEVATLQLEFRYLSEVTGDYSYWKAVEKVMKVVEQSTPGSGLASIFMNPENGQFVQSTIKLGSRGDSYYEYLLKQYLQTARTETGLRSMYDRAMGAVHEHLLMRTPHTNFLHTSELTPLSQDVDTEWSRVPKQDHLACFLGGSLMLGAVEGGFASIPPKSEELSAQGKRDWKTGYELIKTCMHTHRTTTGLAPEVVHFRTNSDPSSIADLAPEDWYIKGLKGQTAVWDARYSLRPETVESLFIAFRLTGDSRYRDWGWEIFLAIEKYCQLPSGGYASVLNVDTLPVDWDDKMETFFLSETLKYLFLLFEDSSVLPFTEVVFNTEAHPLPIFTPDFRTTFA